MTKISVIIPTYNRCDKLKKSIDSVLQQTYSNIELIIVDDGSTDDTKEMVEAINDERIIYTAMPANMGPAAARNEGVRLATADVIAFHDSDDLWRPNKLEKQMAYWEMHPEFSMIYCAFSYHIGDFEGRFPSRKIENPEGDVFPTILVKNTIGTPTMLLRKNCFLELGGFDTEFKCLEDWEFALRFAESYLVGFVDEILMDVYYTSGSVSSRQSEYIKARCRMIALYKVYLAEYGLFDTVVGKLFEEVAKAGMLEETRSLLSAYLTGDV